MPIYHEPQREAADIGFDSYDSFDEEPDSSEVVDFNPDESPPYLLGRLETLQHTYKDTMPSGCKSHLRKAILLLQKLINPTTESAQHDFKAGVLRQLGESYSRRSIASGNNKFSLFEILPARSDHDLQTFANSLRELKGR
jgi:hypothetical protein